jgi:hypothetical protein
MRLRPFWFVLSACTALLLLGVRAAGAAEPLVKRAAVVAPPPAPEPAAARPAPASTTPSPQGVLAAPSPPPSLPSPPKLALRLPAFIALGVGGLSAGGAVVTGIMGSERPYDPKVDCAQCTHHPALATTTAVLTGVAAAGVSAGIVLFLAGPRTERPSFTPTIGVSLSSSKASAKAVWTF